ncbi:MAG: spore protease YyaC [Bacillota bacterium]|nr:spore protease YyaC [Bacillota bacterium]
MMDKLEIDASDSNSIFKLRDYLSEILAPIVKANRAIILLCIGTDRSTGDSLGPLVGDKLKFLVRDNVYLYGNLENPVHAKNLGATLEEIYSNYTNPYIIAIDACLGKLQNVGKIFIEDKPLSPGAAMNKDLPKVGDLSIVGIVNISGVLEFMVLQNTRLFTVMNLADTIANGIYHCILKTVGGRKSKFNLDKSVKV